MIDTTDGRDFEALQEEQLARWVEGDAQHLGDRADPTSQCTPDFSCCRPSLLAPPEVRKAFAAATPSQRTAFLMNFLGAMMSDAADAGLMTKKIHIAGKEPPQ